MIRTFLAATALLGTLSLPAAAAEPSKAFTSCMDATSSTAGMLDCIGTENELPALRSVALVASAYGLPRRPLGTVSVIGPLRMDYGFVMPAVREAAAQLSAFVAEVYDER